MTEKKTNSIFPIVIAALAIGVGAVKYGGAFISGLTAPSSDTAAGTTTLIDQGAMAVKIPIELEDPDLNITATMVLGNTQETIDAMSNGLTEDQEAFVFEEVDKLLEQCEGGSKAEELACLQQTDFTLPPYSAASRNQ